MKLAALGQFYHWSRAELLSLTSDGIDFWLAAAAAFNQEVKEARS